MFIGEFNYHKPDSVGTACEWLNTYQDSAILAGGTDLLVEIKSGLRFHQDIIAIHHLSDLRTITGDESELRIGACVTHNEVARSSLVRKFCPAVAEAAFQIGTDQVRNTGTIGGNLCTGASCCDMAPILMALDANILLLSSSGMRRLSLRDFFKGHKETRRAANELLIEVIIPRPAGKTIAGFEKFGLREAASISVASVAVALTLNHTRCIDACVVAGAVAPTPVISVQANELLKGCTITKVQTQSSLLVEIGNRVARDSQPIDDIRGSAIYRRELLKVLTQRAIRKSLQQI